MNKDSGRVVITKSFSICDNAPLIKSLAMKSLYIK